MTGLLTIFAMTVLAVIGASVVLLPLTRGPGRQTARRDHNLAVYRDQLEEIERELAEGRIAQTQAAAARAEIERRVLRTSTGSDDRSAGSGPKDGSRATAWAGALAIPLCAVILYLALGSPGTPDAPIASRISEPEGPSAQRKEFERLTEQLAERLKAGEGDLQGWMMLARSYRTLGRQQEAMEALRRALSVAGGLDQAPPTLLEEYGEALFLLADGKVTDEARQAFEAALRQQPRLFKARHYLAVRHLQSGEPERAVALWREMVRDSPEGAPWLPELQRRIVQLSGEAPPAEADGPAESVVGPTAEDVRAAAGMAPEERAAFVRSMVDRLATRLETSPEDPEGWARLSRAYRVLGEMDKSEEARRTAIGQFRQRLDSLPPGSPDRPGLEAQLEALGAGS